MEELLLGSAVLIVVFLVFSIVVMLASVFGWIPTLIGGATFVGVAYWIGAWLW